MLCLFLLFYEYYLDEILILNGFYNNFEYTNYRKHHNILDIHHPHKKKLVDFPFIKIRLLEMIYPRSQFSPLSIINLNEY